MHLPAGLSIIANPLNYGDNHLNTILPLPDSASGTTIYRFDPATQNYGEAITFIGFGLGWISADPRSDWLVLNPGEGVFIQTFDPRDITFVGKPPNCTACIPVLGPIISPSLLSRAEGSPAWA